MATGDYVSVTITATTAFPSQVGFGTPAVAGYHTAYPDLIRSYTDLSQLPLDGINSTGVGAATYWAVAAVLSQNPKPSKVKVIRRTNAWTQVIKLFPQSAVTGVIYTVTAGPIGGAALKMTYTVPGASTIATVCAGIKAAFDALGLAVTTAVADGNTSVQCTANVAGQAFVYAARNKDLELLNTTALPANLTADIDNAKTLDDDWYALLLDSNSKAELAVVQPYTEALLKIFFGETGDTEDGKVGVAGTILKVAKAASLNRTSIWFDGAAVPSFLGAGVAGKGLPYDPGSYSYKAKTINGVTVDALSSTAAGELKVQNGNTYTTTSNLNLTAEGVMASGEFIDIQIGLDALSARIKEAILGVFASNIKIPYTDPGVGLFVAAVYGVLQNFVGTNFLAADPKPLVTVPKVKDVDPAQRAARRFPSLSFSANFAGAIHFVGVTGTVQP